MKNKNPGFGEISPEDFHVISKIWEAKENYLSDDLERLIFKFQPGFWLTDLVFIFFGFYLYFLNFILASKCLH